MEAICLDGPQVQHHSKLAGWLRHTPALVLFVWFCLVLFFLHKLILFPPSFSETNGRDSSQICKCLWKSAARWQLESWEWAVTATQWSMVVYSLNMGCGIDRPTFSHWSNHNGASSNWQAQFEQDPHIHSHNALCQPSKKKDIIRESLPYGYFTCYIIINT